MKSRQELTIGIQRDAEPTSIGTVESSSELWAELAKKEGHRVVWIDVYNNGALPNIRKCDPFMWRFKHRPDERALASRLLPVVEDSLGIPVFPDWRTHWHYDDKVAQLYLLRANGIPIPDTTVAWSKEAAFDHIQTAKYPFVVKLATGAGSANVVLVESKEQALALAHRLFGGGVFGYGRMGVSRKARGILRRCREALAYVGNSSLPAPSVWWDFHKNYMYFQEFLPGNTHDTRVSVIGRRAFSYMRFNRPGDFRASGSGNFDPEPSKIDTRFIALAYNTAKSLGTQSIAIDGVYRNGEPVLVEVSYTYLSWMVHSCPGHWEVTESLDEAENKWKWVQGRMWPEEAQYRDFIDRVMGMAGG